MRLTDEQLENLIKLEPNDLLMGLFTELLELRAELELRRKVMADIPLRCSHCGCDWDYEAKEQVEAMNLKASIEAYDAMDEQEQG
jgi:hypothetical protein